VPAVIVAIVFAPLVVVEPVKPAPMVIVPAAVGKRKITTPLPPLRPFAVKPPRIALPPAPPPVFADPATPDAAPSPFILAPFPPPPVPPVPGVPSDEAPAPPPA
jgi:hypothetical protein